jgi:FAD/FMN-containing dehydrogenase/Fe-S oxidoreductase
VSIPSQQLIDELRGVVRGAPIADALARGLYATDASPFHLLPAAVVAPLDEDDLRAVVKYAHGRGVSIVPRGAGTGLAGEALGSGIVLDLSTHFRTIESITDDTVTVGPGVVLAELNAALAKVGRRFAPDPASGASCTLGGMIATNASGGTAFLHGYTRDHIRSLRFILDDGTVCGPDDPFPAERAAALLAMLDEHRELIETHRPKSRFDRCGYPLHELLARDEFDFSRLFAGSEGTLGIVTRATLRTVPLAGGIARFVLGFATLDVALQAGPALRAAPGMAGCDVLDQRLLSLAKVPFVPPLVGAVLIGSIEADTERDAIELAKGAVDAARAIGDSVTIQEPTSEPAELVRIGAFRESAVSGLYAIGKGRRPEAFVEDAAVPGERLPEYVAKVQELLRADEINASFLIHLLAGQVHARPMLDVLDPVDRAKMWPLADRVHALAIELGGTISSQHGVGLARTPWMEKQRGPLLPVDRELKRIFDPKNLLNPGKLLGPDPSRPAWPMTPVRSEGKTAEKQTLLIWNETKPSEEAAKCNGCGDCRPRTGPVRMCPIFRVSGDEAATPRAKANAVKLLDDPARMDGDDVAAIARLCVNCRMCRDECRAKVDVPKLMLEAKAAHYAEHGLRRHEWLLARAESLVRFAGQFSWTMNVLLGSRWSRWLLEKAFGLSRRAPVPRFTHRTYLRRAWWAGLTRLGAANSEAKKVAYFIDVYANYCDPGIGESAVAVLKHHGYDVHVPWRQRGSGMTPLTYGDADGAREMARYNVRALADLVRDGYTIVCTEPAAAIALTQDYPALLADADAGLVARNTVELMALLGDLHDRGELKAPTRELPLGLGHHVPCHVKALGRPAAAPAILSRIPGATVDTADDGCSGMAGTWGLAARHRDDSLRAGAEMIAALDRPRILYGSTECSACRLQIQDATGKRTFHPVQWLAHAYGLVELEL